MVRRPVHLLILDQGLIINDLVTNEQSQIMHGL